MAAVTVAALAAAGLQYLKGQADVYEVKYVTMNWDLKQMVDDRAKELNRVLEPLVDALRLDVQLARAREV